MKIHARVGMWAGLALLPLALTAGYLGATEQKNATKHACSEPNPESLANASNTCGSASEPCLVDIKRTGMGVEVTPSIANAKRNVLFSVKVGTTVTWQSTQKNTGFVLDFDQTSPFDPPGVIMGGSDRTVSVVAKRPGCYKYTAGACVAGSTYGMCDSKNVELIVVPADK